MKSHIVLITGTNGVGKTTLYQYLKTNNINPKIEFHDIDDEEVPTTLFETNRDETITEILKRLKENLPLTPKMLNKISVFKDLNDWRHQRVIQLYKVGKRNYKMGITTVIFGVSFPSDLIDKDLTHVKFVLLHLTKESLETRLNEHSSPLSNNQGVNISYLWQEDILKELKFFQNKSIIEMDNSSIENLCDVLTKEISNNNVVKV